MTDAGDALIVYRASLAWRGLKMACASVSWFPSTGEARTDTALDRAPAPSHDGDVIAWNCQPLAFNGVWRAQAPAVERILLENDRGVVKWACIQPQASVKATLSNAIAVTGLGYVERLDMTLTPWNLPIDELRWGRFISPNHCLVWIDWAGSHPLRLVFYNGEIMENAKVSDLQIIVGGSSLNLSNRRVLREGLVAGVLEEIPGLMHMIPHRMRGMHEAKWLSLGAMSPVTTQDTTPLLNCGRIEGTRQRDEGWAIHERVRWGR